MSYEWRLFKRGITSLVIAPIGPMIGLIIGWPQVDFWLKLMAFSASTGIMFTTGFWLLLKMYPLEEDPKK